MLARNNMLFGNPFDMGYPPNVEGGRATMSFDTPIGVGLFAFLLSPGKSMLLFAALLLFYARYTLFEGGYSFGPRYLLPGIWLLGLTLGVVVKDGSPRVRALAGALVVAGVLVNLIGLATSPLEDMAGGRYYDADRARIRALVRFPAKAACPRRGWRSSAGSPRPDAPRPAGS